jgi:hypothetical protein
MHAGLKKLQICRWLRSGKTVYGCGPINDSTSPDNRGLRYGSVQSGLMGRSDWTGPQTGNLGQDGLGLD